MILVASTMAEYVTDRPETSVSWLANAEAMVAEYPDTTFFAALETSTPGIDTLKRFRPVIQRLLDVGGCYYRFSYTDYRETISSGNRLNHIIMGRNIIQDRAMDIGASHILFLDADMCPPTDAIPKLLELNYPIVGGEVPTYGLTGPRAGRNSHAAKALGNLYEGPDYPDEWDVRQHMNTAGFLLVERQIFKRVRWRFSIDDGLTDDPCYEQDAREFLGYPTYVRHDTKGQHHPHVIAPIETRYPDRDMKVKDWA